MAEMNETKLVKNILCQYYMNKQGNKGFISSIIDKYLFLFTVKLMMTLVTFVSKGLMAHPFHWNTKI